MNAALESRRADLLKHGFACSCPRCVLEGGQEAHLPALSPSELHLLANQATEEGRHGDALALLSRAIDALPASSSAAGEGLAGLMQARGAVELTLGRWSDAHATWREAHAAAPGHALLAQQAQKDARYHGGGEGHGEGEGSATGAEVGSEAVAVGSQAAHLTAGPVLSSEECSRVVELVEQRAREVGGWTTSRHYTVPTTDIPVHAHPEVLAWFRGLMRARLAPLLARQYPAVVGDPRRVRVHDAFVVKYSAAAGQRWLPTHRDESMLSLTIALNGIGEYEGGGTYFPELGRALRPEGGHVLSFPGSILHGGEPVVAGVRYIVAAFLWVEDLERAPQTPSDPSATQKLQGQSS
mmetsp:Transcript_57902/g.183667  ORF Transcript_57902/g.183667 Transcript_57902/m.183667 type:complete len:353 (-) Transcript_57902:73-1131(-)